MGRNREGVMTLTASLLSLAQVVRPHELVQGDRGATFGARARPFFPNSSSALGGDPMSVQVTPHPKWVADLDAALDPGREAILDTRVIVDGFNVPKERFQIPEPMLPEVKEFHAYLTEMCRGATFGTAVSATNYAVEGVAQKISEKALRGLAKNEKIGPRGRWWLEEHAKYDDEHPIHALEIIKDCVKRGSDDPDKITQSALESLELMRFSMEASYHA